MNRSLISLLACVLFVSPAIAQEGNSEGSFELGVWKRLNAKDMLYFPASVTRANEVDHSEALAGAGYDRVLSHGFSARVGYRYLWELSPPEDVTPYREHRGIGELFGHLFEGSPVEMLNRTRFEARWLDGAFSWRLRERVRSGTVFKLRHARTLAPYASLEASYDSRFNTINRLRPSIGFAYKWSNRILLDVYSARQFDSRGASRTDALGITLNLYY